MKNSKRTLLLLLAVICGTSALLPAIAAAGDDLVTLCFRTRTVQVPFYLRPRYITAGAMDGACPTSP